MMSNAPKKRVVGLNVKTMNYVNPYYQDGGSNVKGVIYVQLVIRLVGMNWNFVIHKMIVQFVWNVQKEK
jgi:hypothetical protein